MFRDLLGTIVGIKFLSIIGLIIFVVIFLVILYQVIFMDKKYIETVERLPLEGDEIHGEKS